MSWRAAEPGRLSPRWRHAGLGLGLTVLSACDGEESVTVPEPQPNRPPVVASAIGGVEVETGGSQVVDVSAHFNDPDGEALTYTATSSAPVVATSSVSGSAVTVTGVSPGRAEVMVTARDPGGLEASQSFEVTVPNRPPVVASAIGGVEVETGGSQVVDVSAHFNDPDGEALTYTATSSAPVVATSSVSGSAVTVTGVSPGRAEVMVTARDPGGLEASQSFEVTVPNRPPVVASAIGAVEVEAGSPLVVEVSGHFNDPDGEVLTYTATSSAPVVATSSVSGSAVTVTGVSPGRAEVTVTARDPGGLEASQSFEVTVPNRPPVVASAIGAVEVEAGGSLVVEVSGHFNDPDGEALTYTATSSAPVVATSSVSGSAVTVTGVSPGRAAVTVTARDPGGLEASQSFEVTVPNRPPVVASAIGAVEVEAGSPLVVEVSGHFNDPDGEVLTYTATSSAPVVATSSVSGSAVTVTGVSPGRAEVTVTARDPGGLEASQSFEVTVPNRPPVVASAIGAVEVETGGSQVVDVSAHFIDPDG